MIGTIRRRNPSSDLLGQQIGNQEKLLAKLPEWVCWLTTRTSQRSVYRVYGQIFMCKNENATFVCLNGNLHIHTRGRSIPPTQLVSVCVMMQRPPNRNRINKKQQQNRAARVRERWANSVLRAKPNPIEIRLEQKRNCLLTVLAAVAAAAAW